MLSQLADNMAPVGSRSTKQKFRPPTNITVPPGAVPWRLKKDVIGPKFATAEEQHIQVWSGLRGKGL